MITIYKTEKGKTAVLQLYDDQLWAAAIRTFSSALPLEKRTWSRPAAQAGRPC